MGGSKRKEASKILYQNKKSKFHRNRYKNVCNFNETTAIPSVDNIPCSLSFKKLFNKEVIQVPQNIIEDFNFVMSFILLKNAKIFFKCPECKELS